MHCGRGQVGNGTEWETTAPLLMRTLLTAALELGLLLVLFSFPSIFLFFYHRFSGQLGWLLERNYNFKHNTFMSGTSLHRIVCDQVKFLD